MNISNNLVDYTYILRSVQKDVNIKQAGTIVLGGWGGGGGQTYRVKFEAKKEKKKGNLHFSKIVISNPYPWEGRLRRVNCSCIHNFSF